MCGITIARLHISRSEFYDLTPIELDFALKEIGEIEKFRQQFELIKMRLQTFYLLNIQLSQESRFDSPEDMIPFSFDLEKPLKEIIELNEEDWLTLDKKYSKWHFN